MQSVMRLPSAPSTEHEAPGGLVRRIRREQGVALEKLGQKTGYSAAQLSRLERGISPMTVDALRAFADALDIPSRALGPLLDTLQPGRHIETMGPYPRIPVPTLAGREEGESEASAVSRGQHCRGGERRSSTLRRLRAGPRGSAGRSPRRHRCATR